MSLLPLSPRGRGWRGRACSAAPGEGGLALNGTANLTGAYYRLIRQANLTASSIGSAIGQIESPGSAGLGQADRQAGRRSDRAAPFKRTLKMKKLMTVLVAALALGSSPSRPILPRQDTAMAVATDGMAAATLGAAVVVGMAAGTATVAGTAIAAGAGTAGAAGGAPASTSMSVATAAAAGLRPTAIIPAAIATAGGIRAARPIL